MVDLKKVCYDVSVKCLLICIVFESVFSKIFIISFIKVDLLRVWEERFDVEEMVIVD